MKTGFAFWVIECPRLVPQPQLAPTIRSEQVRVAWGDLERMRENSAGSASRAKGKTDRKQRGAANTAQAAPPHQPRKLV